MGGGGGDISNDIQFKAFTVYAGYGTVYLSLMMGIG
jgi:hypothetical protein